MKRRHLRTFMALMSVNLAANACEALYDAAAKGELERVIELVASTDDVAACQDKWGFTPLHGVVTGHGYVTDDDVRIAQHLIDKGANVEATTDTGATPLMICPYPELIALLVDNGANLEATDNNGATALHYYAGDSNGPAALKTALALGANPNHSDKHGRTALQIAISRSEDDKVQLLRQFGAE